MTETDKFKIWLQNYLLDLDKDFDTEVYIDYIYEILTNFSPNPCNKSEIIENLHGILESLLPDIEISKSDDILNKYICEMNSQGESRSNSELIKNDVLLEIIEKDKNAIDNNKRLKAIDPKYAIDYKDANARDSDESSFSEGDIDSSFNTLKLEPTNKIDDVLNVFESENHSNVSNQANGKTTSVSITKEFLLKKRYNSDSDDSDDPDYNPISDEFGRSNRDAVDKAAQEMRAKMKDKHQQKKEKDKLDRAKQKEQVKARKENEKKRTQKSERRR